MAVICNIEWHAIDNVDYELLIEVYKKVVGAMRVEGVGNIRIALTGTREKTAKWLKTES